MLEVWREARHELAESPVWDWRTGQLWWVDIFSGTVHGSSTERIHSLPGPVGSIGLERNGRLVAATSGGIVLVDEPDGHLVYLDLLTAELAGRKRTNDGKVGPDGAFWFGTMRDGSSTAVGGLFRTDSNGVTTPHLKELHIPNGLDWTRDARHMFHIDTRTSLLTRYPFHGDCLGVPDQEIDLSAYEGSPDGMTIDSDGNLWICFWKGWAIRKISPDGELLLEIPMPVSNPTSCTFGGDDMSKLFISTASYGLTDSQLAQEPFAGSIFTLSTTSTGIRANLFG